ncbi:MAG: 50S ribosomal protein L33 [Candidatus Nealsonbacteria bacterium]|nr:50S ribosomal protein L33 [Candidatus Nealsonbacteria bacterium]
MATKKKPTYVKLQCEVCKKVNYYTHKSKQRAGGEKKLGLKKFCKSCRKHTAHKEAKK